MVRGRYKGEDMINKTGVCVVSHGQLIENSDGFPDGLGGGCNGGGGHGGGFG